MTQMFYYRGIIRMTRYNFWHGCKNSSKRFQSHFNFSTILGVSESPYTAILTLKQMLHLDTQITVH